MKISVRVKPGARTEGVEKTGDAYVVRVKAPAREGRANEAVIKILSEYFKIPKSKISVLRGERSRNKIIELARPGGTE